MEYVIGVGLALGTGLFAAASGLDRDRALYPAILIVIASYYDLFAVMGDSDHRLDLHGHHRRSSPLRPK